MEEFFTVFIILISVFAVSVKDVSASGKISIRFVRYENPGGEGDNGHCCDGRAIFCFGACDHKFLVCVDDRHGITSMGRCPYGRVQTGVVEDADTIVFYNSIGGTRNPMVMNFNQWPGSVKVKVYIEDHDDNSNDYVDYVDTVITVTPARSEQTSRSETYVLRRRTRLTIDVKVYCDPNYFGRQCDVYCEPRDDISGHFTCDPNTGNRICKPGWAGSFCASSHDDCIGNQCKNGATCLDSHQAYICICPDGFTGNYCDQDLDECSVRQPCANGGTCINYLGGYSCNCAYAWTGTDCSQSVDFCESSPCKNNAMCHSNQSGYLCTCSDGWTGSQCDVNVNECLQLPCFHNGTCIDTAGSFECLCLNGSTGILCEVNIDECASNPCNHSNATCIDVINGYECSCPPGITGINCELSIDECLSFPCMHNGTCTDLENGFHCTCLNGTTGLYCETNVNDCATNPCMNDATCEDLIGHFNCICGAGFTGSLCEMDINECDLSEQCLFGGQCENNHGSFVCHCTTGRTGQHCEVNINECQSQPCLNEGICSDLDVGFNCTCATGYTGSICDVEINECNSDPCRNNGTCIDKVGTSGLFQIQLPFTLDSTEEDIIRKALENILDKSFIIMREKIRLETSFKTATEDDGHVSTVVSMEAYCREQQLDQSFLHKLFTPDKLAELKDLLDQHKEDSVQLLQRSDVNSSEKESWLVSHWYAILIIILAVILLGVIPVGTHLIQKRRHKVAEIDMSAYWQSSQEPSSLGFENIVYNVEHQPLHHGIPINRELTEETSEFTMEETSNGGPMNSFRNERLDS